MEFKDNKYHISLTFLDVGVSASSKKDYIWACFNAIGEFRDNGTGKMDYLKMEKFYNFCNSR